MFTLTRQTLLLGAACFVAVASPVASRAETAAAEPETIHVPAGDLDLSTEQGAATLRSRIAHAAVKICGHQDGHTVSEMAPVWACRRAAIAGATPSADALIASAQSTAAYRATHMVASR